jgi:urease accessory protein
MREAATIMATMTTATDPRPLLHLLAWLSPAFPTGGFAYSHGLEWAVEAGDIRDAASLCHWLEDVVARGSVRFDTILLRHAFRNASDPSVVQDIAALALASTPSRERRDEALNQGRAFCLAVAPWTAIPDDLPYAVGIGVASAREHIPEDDAAVAFIQAFVANLISAAVRLVPLGQTAGLRVLAALEPVVIATAEETKTATLDDIGGCAFRSDLAAMRHETQYTRLFRS